MTKKKTFRIAFVTPIYLPANLYGSDTFVRELSEAFAQAGYDTSVITSDAMTPMQWYLPIPRSIPNKREVINGVTVYRLGTQKLFSIFCFLLGRFLGGLLPRKLVDTLAVLYSGPALQGLEELIKRQQFDVIHCSPFPLYVNKQVEDIVKRLSHKPIVVLTPFFHTKVQQYANSLLGTLLRESDRIHTVTESEKIDLVKMHKVHPKKIQVIPLFLDEHKLHEVHELGDEIESFRKTHNLKDKKVILFAGLKGEMKGAIDVLTTVEHMHSTDPSYYLVAMGHNTTEWEKAKTRIRPKSLIDLGYKKGREKEVIFASCDVFCMPSKSESFGLVYLEAWHKRKPVIAADIPAMNELIGHVGGGLLVPFGSQKKLGSAIEQLMGDPVLSKQLGKSGYRAVRNTYVLHRVLDKYQKMFL